MSETEVVTLSLRESDGVGSKDFVGEVVGVLESDSVADRESVLLIDADSETLSVVETDLEDDGDSVFVVVKDAEGDSVAETD